MRSGWSGKPGCRPRSWGWTTWRSPGPERTSTGRWPRPLPPLRAGPDPLPALRRGAAAAPAPGRTPAPDRLPGGRGRRRLASFPGAGRTLRPGPGARPIAAPTGPAWPPTPASAATPQPTGHRDRDRYPARGLDVLPPGVRAGAGADLRAGSRLRVRRGAASVITVLGGGVAGAAVARALARRGRRDVVVFDPAPRGLGSTGKAFGGFRTQQGSPINIALSLASRPFFEARADRVGFRPVGYLYLATSPAGAEELRRRAAFQRAQGLPIEHPDPGGLVPFVVSRGVLATNYCRLDGVYRPLDVLSCLVEEATA